MDGRAPVRRVLRPTSLEEDESLVGAVRRCAFDHGLPSTGVLLREAVAAPHAWSNLSLRDDVDVERLAEAMRTDADEIAARMHRARRAASFVVLRTFHGTEIRGYDLRPGLRRIPAALPSDGHHRALWHVATIPFCRDTGEMLADTCARCERRLEWSAATRLNHCSVCDDKARPREGRPLPDASLRETGLMTGLLDPRATERADAKRALAPELGIIGPGAAFDLGWSIARLFDRRVDRARSDDASLPAEVKVDVLRRGSQIVGDWPCSLRTMLQGAVAEDAARAKHVLHGLRAMIAERTAWPEQAGLIDRTIPTLIGRSRPAIAELHGPLVNSDDARRELRIDPRTLRRLVEDGPLAAVDLTPSKRLCVGLDRIAVERLRDLKADCASIAEAADALGITQAGVTQLVALGEIEEHSDPALGIVRRGRQVSRAGLRALQSRIIDRTSSIDGAAIPLRRAARSIGGEKPWGRILAAAASGALPISVAAGVATSRRLTDLIAIPVAELRALSLIEDLGQDEGEADVSRIDAADILNLTPRRLLDALDGELRHVVLPNGRLCRSAVVAHARIHMSFSEISVRTGEGRGLPTRLEASGVPRLGVAGWERSAAERWVEGRRRNGGARPTDARVPDVPRSVRDAPLGRRPCRR